MIVTQEILNKGLSVNGALNSKQLKVFLGHEDFPSGWPTKGWKSRILGSRASKEQIDRFLRLTDCHLENTGNLFTQKRRATDNWADFDAIVSIDDQNHMNSIAQELRSA